MVDFAALGECAVLLLLRVEEGDRLLQDGHVDEDELVGLLERAHYERRQPCRPVRVAIAKGREGTVIAAANVSNVSHILR